MRKLPRFFSRSLRPGERRIYRAAAVLFAGIFAALVWPIYSWFAGIRPRVLGLPFSLVYVVALVVLSFLALLALFLWEGRRGVDE